MPKALLRLLALALLPVLLLACSPHGSGPVESGGASPDAAVLESVRLLRDGNFDGLWQHALPPADYAAYRASWSTNRDRPRITPENRQQFAATMATLTAPDAQEQLWKKLQPQLALYERKYKNQMPTLIGMLETMAGTAIDRSTTLSDAERQQARSALPAIGSWAQGVDWGDPAKARAALGILTDTARRLNLHTLDQVDALDYAQANADYGLLWSALKRLLAVYGLSLDDVLNSAQTKVLSDDGHVAVVRLSFDLLGKPISSESTMIRQDGRWYDRDTLLAWRKRAAALATQPAAAASAAATKPARAASTAATARAPATVPSAARSAPAGPTR